MATNSFPKLAPVKKILTIPSRVFRFLVEKCNETLVDPSMKKVVFIGVLDIAGFEIFKVSFVYCLSSFCLNGTLRCEIPFRR